MTHGFQKRFMIAVAPSSSPHDEDLPSLRSKELIQGLHTFLYEHAINTVGKHTLDGYALTLYQVT